MKVRIELEGEAYDVDVERTPDGLLVGCEGLEIPVRLLSRGPPVRLGTPEGERAVDLPADDEAVVAGRRLRFDVLRYEPGSAAAMNGLHHGIPVHAVMPGRLVKVLVAPGDAVHKGQPLFVLEAMKMQNELGSPVAGRVGEMTAREGDVVEAGRRLATVEPGTV